MRDDEKQRIRAAYDERYAAHGYSPATLGWPKARHWLRFSILLSRWRLDGMRVLDFGCGFGDLYGYLRALGVEVDYHGIDLNPTLIDEGRRRYPEARLEAVDAFASGLDGRYDFVLSSGVHNIQIADPDRFLGESFAFFAAHAERGFAANFLSDRVDRSLPHANHTSPMRALEEAYRHSRRVVLRNDYMPFEFTVFVDLQQEIDPDLAIYPEYRDAMRFPGEDAP